MSVAPEPPERTRDALEDAGGPIEGTAVEATRAAIRIRISSAVAAAMTVAAGVTSGSAVCCITKLRRASPSATRAKEYYHTISTSYIYVVLDYCEHIPEGSYGAYGRSIRT
jgi:hypothetical protein